MKFWITAAVFLAFITACGGDPQSTEATNNAVGPGGKSGEIRGNAEPLLEINGVAERFVKLGLALGAYDKDFVDAYHGPPEWAEAVKEDLPSLDDLEREAFLLIDAVSIFMDDGANLREAMLSKQLNATLTRIQMAKGVVFSFDDETLLLYDARAPQIPFEKFDEILAKIEKMVPGDGRLSDRVDSFRQSFAIPDDKISAVFDRAIDECRTRTLAQFELPESERFSIEYVTDKPWSGYNWYQGDFRSLIQVNTDLPIIIDRAVDLGCHEGYPGHHTWNVLLEENILKAKGWVEYSIYPLFSPMSLIAEGSANYGIDLAFPEDEKIAFERDVLFPLAGLDPALAEEFDRLSKAIKGLSHARNQIARRYLDGDITRNEAITLSMKYGLSSRKRAAQSIDFVDAYRGYVINYNLGKDLVRDHIDAETAAGIGRWSAFKALLMSPTSAGELSKKP